MNVNPLENVLIYNISKNEVQDNKELLTIIEVLKEYNSNLSPSLDLEFELTYVKSEFMLDYNTELTFIVKSQNENYEIEVFSLMFKFNRIYPLHIVYEDIEVQIEDSKSLRGKLNSLFMNVFNAIVDEDNKEIVIDEDIEDDNKGVYLKASNRLKRHKKYRHNNPIFTPYYRKVYRGKNIGMTEDLKQVLEEKGYLEREQILNVVASNQNNSQLGDLLENLRKANLVELVEAEEINYSRIYKPKLESLDILKKHIKKNNMN